jgi:LAS superfamily LD-carboxypeptidase LdcB
MMRRLEFIKTNLLAGIGLSVCLPGRQNITPSKDYLTGRKNPYINYTKSMHVKAYDAYLDMHKCALKQGINIQIVSGYRSFERQLKIWNYKYKAYKSYNLTELEIIEKVATYSAIPGTSRHHWGTEIDIVDSAANKPVRGFLITENYEENGTYHKMHLWLEENAHLFGFYMVYTKDENRTGFRHEPWHFSYQPVSSYYLKCFSKLNLLESIKSENIFGNNNFDKNCLKSYFDSHLLGINPLLLP